MLNPFIIEKGLFDNLTMLQEASKKFRAFISERTLKNFDESLDPFTKEAMKHHVQQAKAVPKQYKCKICKKIFDDGRKLGGHVSRAHKDLLSDSKSQSEEEIDYIYCKQTKKRGKKISKCASVRSKNTVKLVAIYQSDEQ